MPLMLLRIGFKTLPNNATVSIQMITQRNTKLYESIRPNYVRIKPRRDSLGVDKFNVPLVS